MATVGVKGSMALNGLRCCCCCCCLRLVISLVTVCRRQLSSTRETQLHWPTGPAGLPLRKNVDIAAAYACLRNITYVRITVLR